jgi:hypothetical protein
MQMLPLGVSIYLCHILIVIAMVNHAEEVDLASSRASL